MCVLRSRHIPYQAVSECYQWYINAHDGLLPQTPVLVVISLDVACEMGKYRKNFQPRLFLNG